jgi:hypothetical protein
MLHSFKQCTTKRTCDVRTPFSPIQTPAREASSLMGQPIDVQAEYHQPLTSFGVEFELICTHRHPLAAEHRIGQIDCKLTGQVVVTASREAQAVEHRRLLSTVAGIW